MLESIIVVLFTLVKIIGLVILAGTGLFVVAILAKILIEVMRYIRND